MDEPTILVGDLADDRAPDSFNEGLSALYAQDRTKARLFGVRQTGHLPATRPAWPRLEPIPNRVCRSANVFSLRDRFP